MFNFVLILKRTSLNKIYLFQLFILPLFLSVLFRFQSTYEKTKMIKRARTNNPPESPTMKRLSFSVTPVLLPLQEGSEV